MAKHKKSDAEETHVEHVEPVADSTVTETPVEAPAVVEHHEPKVKKHAKRKLIVT